MVCWGWNEYGQTVGPGTFTAVSVGGLHSCGLRTDGTVTCWGQDEEGESWTRLTEHGATDSPSGSFSAVSAGWAHSCGLRTGGTVACWGNNRDGQTDAPSGTFAAVSAGRAHSCGVRADQTATCWGSGRFGQTDAPSGSFSAVSAGSVNSCGLRADQSIVCWGHDGGGRLDVPSGSFSSVAARGNEHYCGLRTNGSIVCWGARAWSGTLPDAPSGSFSAVSTNTGLSCGLRTNGSVTCWHTRSYWREAAPTGTFTGVSVGAHDVCGMRPEGAIRCWGDRKFKSADPSGPGELAAVDDAGVHQPAVEALRRDVSGIFEGTGCEEGLCPHDPLRRWEMAVWLVRFLDGTDPARQAVTRFDDVDAGVWWAPYTDRLAELGVTAGCATGPLRFCPDKTVTRGEMATFLVRAFDLAAASPAGFSDTGGDTHSSSIDALAAAGVTAGCATNPLRYCPSDSVTRAEMATFLQRAVLWQKQQSTKPEAVQVSDDVPDVNLTDLATGRTVNLRSVVRGDKALLFWFWASW